MINENVLHQKRVVQILCGLLIFIQVILYASTYSLAALFGQLHYPVYMISDTISGDPGRAIASFFFPMLAILIFVIGGSRISRMHPIFTNNYDGSIRKWRIDGRLFSVLHVSLITTVVGVVGVAAVPVTLEPILHTIIAGIMIGAGTLSSVLFTILDYRLGIVRARWIKNARVFIAAFGVAAAITFGVLLESEPFAASVFEIIETLIFSIYLTTFGHPLEFPLVVDGGQLPLASNPPI